MLLFSWAAFPISPKGPQRETFGNCQRTNVTDQTSFQSSKQQSEHWWHPRILQMHENDKVKRRLKTNLTIFGSVRIQTRSGIKNAAVFPLPVSATPMTSRFSRPIGMACLWIGDGSFMNNKYYCYYECYKHNYIILKLPPLLYIHYYLHCNTSIEKLTQVYRKIGH